MRHDFVITVQHSDAPKAYKDQFNALMTDVFGFDFSDWHKHGGWNQDYACYSIIEGGEILSNVSVYSLNMLIHGQEKQIFQIGAVATRRKCRGRGLSRQIFKTIFEQNPEMPAFLCAHDTVTDFYKRLGFTSIRDRQPVIRVDLSQRHGQIKKLSVEDPVVWNYLNERVYFSDILDFKNAAPIHFFHLLHALRDCIYEVLELQTLVIVRQKGEILTLYDVVSRERIIFEALCRHLNFPGVNLIQFGFNPDWLLQDYEWVDYAEDPIFVRGDTGLGGDFILPLLVRT